MITVTFLNGCILATAEQSLWQYSYNQQLQINGLELPGVFTVDFCNEGDTTTVAMIGSSGVVGIPNELLTSGRDIVAYVFQKSVLTGGITRCEIRIDVLTRPERDDETPTPEQEAVIDQYIAELNEGVENAETAAANAQTSEDNAAASAADAQQSKADAAASASAAADSASDASNSAAAAAQSAVNASNSAANAANASGEASGYAEDSEAWAIGKRGGVDVGSSDVTYHNNSKYFAEQAFTSSSNANSSASAAAQSERDAAASANGAAQSASSATASKNAAANFASAAAGSATAAQSSATSAAASATAASGSATSAGNSSAAAAQSATEAGNAQTAAEAAQTAAEEAAASVGASAAQIAQNTSDISAINDKIPSTASKNNKLVAWSTFNGLLGTKQDKITANGILKGDGAGGVSAAVAGTDYLAPPALDAYRTAAAQDEIDAAQDEDIADVKAAVDQKAPIIINSASGDIAHFEDGADNMPVKQLSVNVEPIQDLHGYDSPWPAGGGKNLLQNTATTQTLNGLTFIVNSDGTVLVNGTATATTSLNINSSVVIDSSKTYILSGCPIGGDGGSGYSLQGTGGAPYDTGAGSSSFSEIAGGGIRIRVASGFSCNNLLFKPMIRLASETDATFSPYSNICPISGRTSATVTRTGKNLNPNLGNQFTTNNSIKFYLKAGTYTVSTSDGTAFDTNNAVYFHLLDGDNNTITKGNMQSDRLTLNSSETFYYGGQHFNSITFALLVDAYMLFGFNNQLPAETYSLQLELGSTASAYEPYAGNTYTIALGDTVYGGTLDVTQGKMVVDMAELVPTALKQGAYAAGGRFYPWIALPFPSVDYSQGFCNKLKCARTFSQLFANVSFMVRQEYLSLNLSGAGYESAVDAIAAGNAFIANNDVQFVYPLAQPIEITLTPTQIETLIGQNNIWSDAGDVSVDYRADTKLYIDNIHQPTDDDMTADAQIASGKYFLVGGNLYKSTTVIPAGDTIIPGTNCIKTNLAEALNALNA